jgi:hypothetical protein
MTTQTTIPPAPLVPTSAMATEPVAVDLETDAEAMSERFFAGALATLELAPIHLGLRLGLYQAVHDLGPVTAAQLANPPRLRRAPRRSRSPRRRHLRPSTRGLDRSVLLGGSPSTAHVPGPRTIGSPGPDPTLPSSARRG